MSIIDVFQEFGKSIENLNKTLSKQETKKKEKKMNLRLRALDRETNQIVKCTLRRQVNDLTVDDLSIPAYTHEKGGKTVSGRLTHSSNKEEFAEYEFVRL